VETVECPDCGGEGCILQNPDGSWNCGCDDPGCPNNRCDSCGGTGRVEAPDQRAGVVRQPDGA
jgi:hypothetical protein